MPVSIPSVYNTWWFQAITHPIIDRARRCLNSVIESTPMSYRRILYTLVSDIAESVSTIVRNVFQTHTCDIFQIFKVSEKCLISSSCYEIL